MKLSSKIASLFSIVPNYKLLILLHTQNVHNHISKSEFQTLITKINEACDELMVVECSNKHLKQNSLLLLLLYVRE
jgi:hypothetical protein